MDLRRAGTIAFIALALSVSAIAAAEDPGIGLDRRVAALETGLAHRASTGLLAFLFGAFCALWAQNTRRRPWLWFFLGAFFGPITVIVLLWKNASARVVAGG